MPDPRLEYLIRQYLMREVSAEEKEELAMLVASSGDESLKDTLSAVWESYKARHAMPAKRQEDIWKMIASQMQQNAAEPETSAPVRSIHTLRRKWLRFAAAASIILVLGTAIVILLAKKNALNPTAAEHHPLIANDIVAPRTNRAMIRRGNGQRVFLDSARNGLLAQQGGVQVMRLDNGVIAYRSTEKSQATSIQYDTLMNPRGSKVINITLADGSKVWLNAGSTLTYPVAFSGIDRRVSIDGEAYFEIAKIQLPHSKGGGKMPFRVESKGVITEVLGTHFDVNAYDDEDATRITLLEGSVKVTQAMTSGTQSTVISPGEQAIARSSEPLTTTQDIDPEQVIAWKNGKFIFTVGTDIQTVMRQISRWYDVDVEYKGAVTKHFWGSIQSTANVSKVLEMLEATGGVHFILKGRKVTVMPGR